MKLVKTRSFLKFCFIWIQVCISLWWKPQNFTLTTFFDQFHIPEPKLTSSQLTELLKICIHELKENQDTLNAQWLPIMSKLMSLCLDQESMLEIVDEREVSGAEFRKDKIRYIQIQRWKMMERVINTIFSSKCFFQEFVLHQMDFSSFCQYFVNV